MVLMAIIRRQITLIEYPEQTFESVFIMVETKEISDATYIHYPMTYDPKTYNHSKTERVRYDFLSRAALGRYQFDPAQCTRVKDPRVIFALSPRNELTEEVLTQIMTWEYQWRGESGYFITMYGLFFESEQDITDYMNHPEYGKADDRPALCAGISYE